MKPGPSKTYSDNDMEQLMGSLLRIGVLISAIVAFIGGVMYVAVHGGEIHPSYTIFKGVPPEYTSLSAVMHGVLTGNAASVMQMGILLLIATPIARILFSFASFIKEKDYLYVVISAIVLGIIVYSIFNGMAGK